MNREGLTKDDLRFTGMLSFLRKDPSIARVERVGLHNFMYDVELVKPRTQAAIEALFQEHCFPMPVEVRELPVRDGITDVYFVFYPSRNFYHVFVHNPRNQ